MNRPDAPSIDALVELMRDTSGVSTGGNASPKALSPTTVERPSLVERPPLVDTTSSKTSTGGFSTTDDVVRFASAHGCEGRLSRSAFVTWRLRLDVESGRLRPYEIGADPLPVDVYPIARCSYDGFVYLLACRWLHTPGAPAPWTKDFAARWCGITPRQAKDARKKLVQLEALIHVGDSHRAKLWLPWGVERGPDV